MLNTLLVNIDLVVILVLDVFDFNLNVFTFDVVVLISVFWNFSSDLPGLLLGNFS